MPATWLSKYGYGSLTPTAKPIASNQPVQSAQPTWIAKYGTIKPGSTAPLSPAFQNAVKNQNAPALNTPAFNRATQNKSLMESVVPDQSQPQTPLQQAGNFLKEVGNTVKETAKQVIDFLPKAPEYIKQAVKHPVTTAAMAGAAATTGLADLAGAVENGIASIANINVPDRWNISKQTQALKVLNDSILKKQGVDYEKAGAVGNFLGSMLPYALTSEAVGASVGAKLLVPTAEKFLPGAVKFIPAINNAITFLGIGQITHNPENGTRIDQFKSDLIQFAMFETGGLALKGISKETGKLIGNVVNDVKGKSKIDFETVQPKVEEVKQSFKTDTGKPLDVVAVEEMTSGKPQKSGIISPNGTQEVTGKTQVPQETKATINENAKVQNGQSSEIKNQVPQNANGKVTKAASDINTNLVKKGFDSIPKEEQAKYTPVKKAEQIQKVSELMTSDIEKAKSVAKGTEPVPNGILPQPIFNAIEQHAIQTGDIQLLKDLAKSPLAKQLSEAGQTLGSHGFNDTPNSPVKAIKQVIDARAKAIEGKYGSIDKATERVVKDIKSKVKAPDKYQWSKFLDSIQC